MESPDAELVQGMIAGDKGAYAELVRRHSKSAFARAYGYTGSPHDAEDMVQDAFLRAYQSIGELRDPAQFGAWFSALLSNLCRDWLRRQKVRRTCAISDDVATMAEAACDDERVKDAVAQLPDEFRSVLVLRFGQDLSYDEIARALGISEELVGVRIMRGKRMMKEFLAAKSGDQAHA